VVVAGLTVGFAMKVNRLGVRGTAGIPLAEDGLNPAPLPAFLGTDWIGQDTEVTAVEREMLPPDTGYARRIYVSLDDRRQQVLVSVVLSGRDRTSIHRPELCLVGQGWTINEHDQTQLGGGSETTPVWAAALLRLGRQVPGKDGINQRVNSLFAYWFVGRDRLATTTFERLWFTALNRLRLRPDRWAYVVVQTVVLPGETETQAQARMDAVTSHLQEQLAPVGLR
jgi:EpsI family protein